MMDNKEIKDHAYAIMYYRDNARTIYDAVNDIPYEIDIDDADIEGFNDRLEAAVDNLHKLGEELDAKADAEERLFWEGLGLDMTELDKGKEFVEKIVGIVTNVAAVSALIGDSEGDDDEDDD